MIAKIQLMRSTMVVVVIALIVAGCSSSGRDGSTRPEKVITAAGEQRGQDQTTLTVGEPMQVRFPSRAGTGYSWRLTSDSSSGSVVQLEQQENEKAAGVTTAGGPSYDRFNFRGIKPGHATLTFVYDRPWEPTVLPAKQFVLDVQVE